MSFVGDLRIYLIKVGSGVVVVDAVLEGVRLWWLSVPRVDWGHRVDWDRVDWDHRVHWDRGGMEGGGVAGGGRGHGGDENS